MRTKEFSTLLVFVFFVLIVEVAASSEAGAPPGRSPEIKNLSAEQAWQLMQQKDDLVVVDVRTARERRISAIGNSVHIEMSDFQREIAALDPEQPVLLYCAVGGRSSVAAKWLRANGYSNIYNLAGGIVQWQRQGYETIRGE